MQAAPIALPSNKLSAEVPRMLSITIQGSKGKRVCTILRRLRFVILRLRSVIAMAVLPHRNNWLRSQFVLADRSQKCLPRYAHQAAVGNGSLLVPNGRREVVLVLANDPRRLV